MEEVISALRTPKAYPHRTTEVKKITTAISHVFLTGDYAYKLCKPVNFGFLDFSNLEKRKKSCEDEIAFNSLISPELYLGLSTINQDESGKITIDGKGNIIEYAVKMKQMDPESTMNNLLRDQKVTTENIVQLAKQIHQFHQKAPEDEEIRSYGKFETVKFNWDENFQQTEKYKDVLIPTETFTNIQQKIHSFLGKKQELINLRVQKKKIKHCHGDFYSSNVFINDDKIHIFDGIVFNKRFPCSDIIAEIAFMAMDLDYHKQESLAKTFIEEYQKLSGDNDIPKLIDFYKCYRAYIRGKIACFTYDDPNLSTEEKEKTKQTAQEYFQLAERYAQHFL
ncbi:gluconokinase [Candidatus Woesearchaeota archaeon]|nr:gluconokinase [Candidatus Woesearchaeota archaeon]